MLWNLRNGAAVYPGLLAKVAVVRDGCVNREVAASSGGSGRPSILSAAFMTQRRLSVSGAELQLATPAFPLDGTPLDKRRAANHGVSRSSPELRGTVDAGELLHQPGRTWNQESPPFLSLASGNAFVSLDGKHKQCMNTD